MSQLSHNPTNPLHHDSMEKFRQYMAGRGGKVFAMVEDGDGTTYSVGDRQYMFKTMKKLNDENRRMSREWIPVEKSLPKLPMPLSELTMSGNANRAKTVASAYINHFLKDRQKLGKVRYQQSNIISSHAKGSSPN